MSHVPSEYHYLQQVFIKSIVLSLQPHRSYDCSIYLFPGATHLLSRLFSLSRSERKCIEMYMKESCAPGTICSSATPLGAEFLFVSKKDGSTLYLFLKGLTRSPLKTNIFCLYFGVASSKSGLKWDSDEVNRLCMPKPCKGLRMVAEPVFRI